MKTSMAQVECFKKCETTALKGLNSIMSKNKPSNSSSSVDKGLVVMFLKMSPEERLQANDNAVRTILELRNAYKRRRNNDRSEESVKRPKGQSTSSSFRRDPPTNTSDDREHRQERRPMNDDPFKFRILFRSPVFPVVVIAEDNIWPASDANELGTLCYISEPPKGQKCIKVVDCRGEEFLCYPDKLALMPGIRHKKWTKKQLIDLFDNSEIAKEKNLKFPQRSISNKRKTVLMTEICALLRHSHELDP